MPYSDLYDFAQTLEVYEAGKQYVSRNFLRDKAISITGVDKIKHIRTGADLGVSRGFWLTPTNTEHRLVQQLGCHIIVTERGLNNCWDRFVYVKELTHIFDTGDGCTASPDAFDTLLGEFASQGPINERSPQWVSEATAVWRALALLCPEAKRQEFAAERAAVKIDDYEIALRLKIPLLHVPKLFSPTFDRMLGEML